MSPRGQGGICSATHNFIICPKFQKYDTKRKEELSLPFLDELV